MAERSQNYQNHVRWLPAFHFFVLPVLLANFLNAVRHIFVWPSPLSTVFAAIVAAALLTLAIVARNMALAVQDRVIRLEMRLRLREILPADLRGRVNDLTRRQLVALRFASDAELPELVRDALAGKLNSSKEIKLRVKDWQADWLRV